MRPIRPRFRTRWVVLAGAAVLAVTAPAAAQTSSSRGGAGSSSGGSSSGGSSLGGSSLGGSTGSSSTLGFSSSTMAGSTSSLGGVTPTTGGGGAGGGGGFGGGTGGRGGAGGTGTIANGISSSNMLYGYYSNPLTWGLLNSRGTGTVSAPFGTALYSSLATQTNTTTRGGFGAGTATVTSGMNLPGPQSTSRRMPTYAATVNFRFNRPTVEQRRTDLQSVLARTSALTRPGGIEVTMDGPTVVLRGQVADDDERRLAENVLRLSPGVRGVRNELQVK